MIWLVEEYDDYIKDLVVEIRKQGHTCDFINYYKMQEDNNFTGVGIPRGCGNWEPDECVLFYGSIQTAQWLLRNRKWIPGTWYTFKNYECTSYYSHLGKHLLNQDYVILPCAEVNRKKDELYEQLGEDSCLFIRPNKGIKSFGGRIFERERWDKDWGLVISGNCDCDDLLILSSPKKVKSEHRFVVAGSEIITGSQYKLDGSVEIVAGYSQPAYDKCREILDDAIKCRFIPDVMYTIDVCEDVDGQHHLMEINCFCCSGMYAGELSAIVSKASELAVREHREYYADQ